MRSAVQRAKSDAPLEPQCSIQLNKIGKILSFNSSLSFLVHYSGCPSSWTSSGSCPLCLTPPCYHLCAAGNGGAFFCPEMGHCRAAEQSRR
jgi:hypothetical protein